jgi:hypothetical protein
MLPTAFIGLGAGAASALLMATMASRSPLSLFLVLLAPLPIMIAAVGWTHWAALFGALAAALALAIVFGEVLWVPIYLVGAGLPAWWLGYLALLARSDTGGGMEWYPVGRLVVWCAVIASIIVTIMRNSSRRRSRSRSNGSQGNTVHPRPTSRKWTSSASPN